MKYGPTLALLALLVSADLAFMLMHGMHAWSPWLRGSHFSLESDRGLAEQYQYIKQLWIVICLGLAFLQTRSKAFAGWMVLFAFLLVDDAAQIHERVGFWLGAQLSLPAIAGLRPDDFGELSFAALVGGLTIGMVALSFRRGSDHSRQLSRDLLCLVVVLAFFGVAVDTLHVIAYFRMPAFSQLLALFEDGGEMLVVSALTCYVFDIVGHGGALRIDVWGTVRSAWGAKRATAVVPAPQRPKVLIA